MSAPTAVEAETPGAHIRQARRKAGLKQHDLAHALGVSQAHISRIERNERIPSATELVRIARACGVRTSIAIGWYASRLGPGYRDWAMSILSPPAFAAA